VGLTPQGQGAVLLGVAKQLARAGFTAPESRRWITRHGMDGHLIAQPIIVSEGVAGDGGALLLTSLGDDRFVVVSGRRLALLEGLRPLWVVGQLDVPDAIVADGYQRITTFRGTYPQPEPATLRRYDSAGDIVWERILPRALEDAQIQSGAGGDLMRSGGIRAEETSNSGFGGQVLHRIADDGSSRWLIHITAPIDLQHDYFSNGPTTSSAVEVQGRIWLSGPHTSRYSAMSLRSSPILGPRTRERSCTRSRPTVGSAARTKFPAAGPRP
jgi:hypothetical protein